MTGKDPLPRRRLAGTGGRERPDNPECVQERLIDRFVRVPDDAVEKVRAQEPLVRRIDLANGGQLGERNPDVVSSRRERYPGAPDAFLRRPQLHARLEPELRYRPAIDEHQEPMLVGKSGAAVAFPADPAEEIYLEFVFPVLWEVVAHEHAAARAERQPFGAIVLAGSLRHAELADLGTGARDPDRRAADAARDRQVLLDARLADFQNARDVVEAVARVVGRQQGRHVDLET